MSRLVAGIGAAVAVALLACGGLLGGVIGGAAAGCMAMLGPTASTSAGPPSPPAGGFPSVPHRCAQRVAAARNIGMATSNRSSWARRVCSLTQPPP